MMKKLISLTLMSLMVFSACKNKENTPNTAETKETSILEKIAYAHGYGNWGHIDKIAFTFNVDRDSSHFERRWAWLPKTNSVTYSTRQDTISYNRKKLDSTLDKTNAGFVNDKYWLLAPFQLIWDKNNFTHDTTTDVPAPISGTPMQKLTIVYGNEGGYTPGDAYDFYFGEDYRIQEWAFRKGNQEEPNMVTTWEDYVEKEGLILARMHKRTDTDFQLYFSDISVTASK